MRNNPAPGLRRRIILPAASGSRQEIALVIQKGPIAVCRKSGYGDGCRSKIRTPRHQSQPHDFPYRPCPRDRQAPSPPRSCRAGLGSPRCSPSRSPCRRAECPQAAWAGSMSMPYLSFTSRTASGLILSFLCVPALWLSKTSPARCLPRASAIWLRQELCTQTNATLGFTLSPLSLSRRKPACRPHLPARPRLSALR